MTEPRPTVCITCGEPAGDPPVLNRLEDGTPCPTCADRVLEGLPAALPTPSEAPEGAEEPVASHPLVDADVARAAD